MCPASKEGEQKGIRFPPGVRPSASAIIFQIKNNSSFCDCTVVSTRLGKIYSSKSTNRTLGLQYRYLKIHRLLGKRAHLVVEAEPIFSSLFRRENRVHLSLLRGTHNVSVVRPCHIIFNVERAARLNLD